MTTFLAILSLAMLCLLVRERRVARRRYGQLICEHRQAMARHGMRRFAEGLNLAKERARDLQDWQESTVFTTGANAVADQPRAGVSCAGREVSVSAPHCKPEEKERREPEPVTSGPNSGILTARQKRMGRDWQEAAR